MTKEQFAELVLDSTDSLYRISKGMLQNESDCEDAVWEAIGIGFARLSTLRHEEYVKTWLTRILINECYRVLRERRHRAESTLEAAACTVEYEEWYQKSQNAGAGKMADSGNYEDLYEALALLEDKYRVPVVLFYLEGYSVREIAEILQSTEGTVKSWLFRGRRYLRKILEEG